MTDDDIVARIVQQERALALPTLDEDAAYAIGSTIHAHAKAAGLRVLVDIRTWDRQLFLACTAGVTADNAEWVRRKANAVQRWQKPTLRMFHERGRIAIPAPQLAADVSDYVFAGGGFPLRVNGAGVVGAITVSGLTGWNDHGLAVFGLAVSIGLDPAGLALPPEEPA
jgi:uncharacterized protein (UPF0303 family)